MTAFSRPAAYAAAAILLAFLMHNINALYIEPQILGFENPRVDYAKVDKLSNALGSVPWRLSGLGHLFSGCAAVILGFWARGVFRQSNPVAAPCAMGMGLVAGVGFLLTGITDLMGSGALGLLSAQNPDHQAALILANSLLRVVVNGLAIVSFGGFMLLLSWCGLKNGNVSRGFCFFGYLSGAVGMSMAVFFLPLYLQVYMVWAFWLCWQLFRRLE